MTEQIFPCEFCDTLEEQVRELVTVTRQHGGKWYIFDHVPALVCPNCGHRYFTPDVLANMEARMLEVPADARPVEAWAISLADQ